MSDPIRILHIVTYMGRGGLETMLMNYYRNIDRSKVQLDFLVHRDFEADYDKEILSLGGKIYHISRLVPWSKAYKNELKAFFKAHPEYKIVHVHQDCLSAVALKAAEECNVPVRIAHSHNSSQDKNLKYLIKLHYMKKIPLYATDYFACGKEAGDWMFGGEDFKVLTNAINAKLYEYSEETSNKIRAEFGFENDIVIGHVGRFNPQKNHLFLIDIFAEIAKLEPKAKLLLVGGGDGMDAIQEKVNSLGLSDKVIFAGVRSDVNELMQAMDVFVFPSLYEGLPVTMIEAQAAGLHCVISDNVSDECIVTNGIVSSKSLNDSPKEWAEYVLSQAKPKENHIREIADNGYDIETATKKLEEFYLERF